MTPSGEQRPTHSQSEPSKTSGSSSASNGSTQVNGSQKLNVEVQVKFNNQMFEEQVKNVMWKNGENLIRDKMNSKT